MKPIVTQEPALVTLEVISKRFKLDEDFFLQRGLLEPFDLIVGVPPTAHIGLTNHSGHIGNVSSMRTPHFLKLSLPDISEIRKAPSASLSRSSTGFLLKPDGSLKALTADEGWDFFEKYPRDETVSYNDPIFRNIGISMTEWTIKDCQTGGPISFRRSDIQIHRAEYQKLKKELAKFVDVEFQRCHSKKVKHLFEASILFWNETSIDYSDRESHHDPKEILEWFIARGFSAALAKAAATIIAPENAKTRGPKPKTGFTHKTTKMSNSQSDKLVP